MSILPHAKQCHEFFKGTVTKGATREVLQYTYLLIISGGGVEGGCLAPKIMFALQDVGKNAKQKTTNLTGILRAVGTRALLSSRLD